MVAYGKCKCGLTPVVSVAMTGRSLHGGVLSFLKQKVLLVSISIKNIYNYNIQLRSMNIPYHMHN